MTTRELAIAHSVIYASLFDYPITLEQLHHTLIGSEQTPPEILAVYDGSAMLQRMIEYREGFFFPIGHDDLIAERRRREARSREFLQEHARVLRLVCALPFTRLVALSGSIAHLNLEPDGDLDLFIVTKGRRVWTVTVAVLLLAKLLRRRRSICANFVLADTHLAIDQQDLFTANQVLHLKPLIGAEVLKTFVTANPFVTLCYPNRPVRRHESAGRSLVRPPGRGLARIKALAELVLCVPSPLIEATCRRLYAWHLRRRANLWRSPDQVRLQSDYLKLHTRSHRHSVLDRFQATVDTLMAMAKPRGTRDLFEIFPDLPGLRKRTAAEQIERVHRQVEETRERAGQNILRQRIASARVREAISARRRR